MACASEGNAALASPGDEELASLSMLAALKRCSQLESGKLTLSSFVE